MSQEKGNLSINSENFLPIIKKWLYTDKDIFVRELVSNACDAVTKLQKLIGIGEAPSVKEDEKFFVKVVADEEKGTIQIIDNGIGMTGEEIKKYINQIAFSGANDFLAKYEEKLDKDNEIIGHFGLGFYSAFMVADRVEIDTLSYQQGAKGAKWLCEGGIDYEMQDSDKAERGTVITLYLGEDGKEFLNSMTLRSTLKKYCAFMPVEIYFEFIESKKDDKEDNKEETAEQTEEKEAEKPVPVNETAPLWLKQPKDCTDEDYKKFYHDVFFDLNDPLFWIHLNMDYPFRLKGILYFPKLKTDMEALEGEVKLYSNQVYIADNIKEVIPEFLLLLKGTIDCPDLPLNVSRSALQNDGYAAKMSAYITKKVADKINGMFKNERESYEKFWQDISVFIKYGCLKEEKFYDRVKESLIYKTTDGKYETLEAYLEENKEKHEKKVFFVTDEIQQVQYINMLKEQGMQALILSSPIDSPFVSFLEYKNKGEVKFARVDADLAENLKEVSENATEEEKKADDALNSELQNLFSLTLDKKTLKVKAESLKSRNVSAVMLLSEESRRMQELKEAYKNQPEMLQMLGGNFEPDYTLVLNKSNGLVKKLIALKNEAAKKEQTDLICAQLYDLALMSQKTLEPGEMTRFIERSNLILERLVDTDK